MSALRDLTVVRAARLHEYSRKIVQASRLHHGSANIMENAMANLAAKFKVFVLLLVLILSVSALGWFVHHILFPFQEVNRVNCLLIYKGMSKDSLRELLGRGWTLSEHETVQGDKVMLFHNQPLSAPMEIIYVGFSNDRVVDKLFQIRDQRAERWQ